MAAIAITHSWDRVLIICLVAETKYCRVGFPSCVVSDAHRSSCVLFTRTRPICIQKSWSVFVCIIDAVCLFDAIYAARGACGSGGSKVGLHWGELWQENLCRRKEAMRVIIFLRCEEISQSSMLLSFELCWQVGVHPTHALHPVSLLWRWIILLTSLEFPHFIQ